MSDAHAEILASLDALAKSYAPRFEAATTEQALRDENAKILGKKGELTAILKQMGQVPGDARKAIGERVNGLKTLVEKAFDDRLRAMHRAAREKELAGPPLDWTIPARPLAPPGHKHPHSIVREESIGIFEHTRSAGSDRQSDG